MSGPIRVFVVTLVVAAWMCAGVAPRAQAVVPPPVDGALLPPSAAPAPLEPTRQREQCSVATFDAHMDSAGHQLDGLDLDAVGRLATGEGQTVAVIDTGVAPHPQLPRLRPGGDYVSDGDGLQDCDDHGTLVAGIIAATTDSADSGFAGVAPGVSLVAIRQSSTKYGPIDGGSGYGDVETLAMAVRTAADMGATVINISSVACVMAEVGLDDRALGAALAYAVDVKDAVVVAAAGNVGPDGQCPQQNPTDDAAGPTEPDWTGATVAASPGWYDDYVLTVGSVNPTESPSQFSLAGPWVDVAAPGEAVRSLGPSDGSVVNAFDDGVPISGTSYAAPVVSGVAALVRERFPQLSARQVMNRIEATARHPAGGWNPFVGSGVVDPLAAISDDPPSPDSRSAGVGQRPIELPDTPPTPDSSGRAMAFTGLAACVAVLAALVALLAPANRLARRGPLRPLGKGDTAHTRQQDIAGD